MREPEAFWRDQAKMLSWRKPFARIATGDFASVNYQWFSGGTLNVCENCVDRHLNLKGDQTAIVWEPDTPTGPALRISYAELHAEVCRLANALKARGVKKGDKVIIYLPMVPEAAYAMLACARIGAVHCVVFAGFSSQALADRMQDCQSSVVITADEARRGGKCIGLKGLVDEACLQYQGNHSVVTLRVTGAEVSWNPRTDVWYHELVSVQGAHCPVEEMEAEDPLFILYTSGSTNKPKGVLHTTAGYLLYATTTFAHVFDYREGEVYWCTADVGWITGHSYLVYGPLACGATTVVFEGVPSWPTPARIWQIIDRHQINILYTAPTLIRALMREGDHYVKQGSRRSLRLLGSVGEPINPEAWLWYYNVCGDSERPVIDTWWQTETGGILISPLPGATALKPGSATLPFFGIEPAVLDADGKELVGPGSGYLCIKRPWPGQARTVFGDHSRFVQTYFLQYPGYYFTGDGCRRDEDGYYWITGRVDDVLNVAGHRLGTAEIESALVGHAAVAEAAVVGFSHDIKGQGIYAFVTLKSGIQPSASLYGELIDQVRRTLGAIAKPDLIQWAPSLPKTRSGKIMRRILRKIVEHINDENLPASLGDTSTLADPNVVNELWRQRLRPK